MSATDRDREWDLNRCPPLAAKSLESMSSMDSFASAPLLVGGGGAGDSGGSNNSIESMSALGSMSPLPSVSDFRTPAASIRTLTDGDDGAPVNEQVIELSVRDHHGFHIANDEEVEDDEVEASESALGEPLVHVNMRDTLRSPQPLLTLTPPTPPVTSIGAVQGMSPVGISNTVSGAINAHSQRSPEAADKRKQSVASGAVEKLAGQSVRVGLSGAGVSSSILQSAPFAPSGTTPSREKASDSPQRASPPGPTTGAEHVRDPQRRDTAPPIAARSTSVSANTRSSNSPTNRPATGVESLPPPPPSRAIESPLVASKARDEQPRRAASTWEQRLVAGEEVAPGEVDVVVVQISGARAASPGGLSASSLLRKPLMAVPEEESDRESVRSRVSPEVQSLEVRMSGLRQALPSATGVFQIASKDQTVLWPTTSTGTAATAATTAVDIEKEVRKDSRGADVDALVTAASTGKYDSRDAKNRSGLEYLKRAALATEKQDAIFRRARLVNDVSAALALVGFALAIAVQECIITDAFGGGGEGSSAEGQGASAGAQAEGGRGRPELNAGPLVAMRLVVTASTALLLALNLYYQTLVLKGKLVRSTYSYLNSSSDHKLY